MPCYKTENLARKHHLLLRQLTHLCNVLVQYGDQAVETICSHLPVSIYGNARLTFLEGVIVEMKDDHASPLHSIPNDLKPLRGSIVTFEKVHELFRHFCNNN